MLSRNSFLVVCFASSVIGGIIASQTAGRDQGMLQLPAARAGSNSVVPSESDCNKCAWNFKVIGLSGPVGQRVQVFPKGTSVVVKCITEFSVYAGEGDASNPTSNFLLPRWYELHGSANDLGIRFTDGMWIQKSFNCDPAEIGSCPSILYRLDKPMIEAQQ